MATVTAEPQRTLVLMTIHKFLFRVEAGPSACHLAAALRLYSRPAIESKASGRSACPNYGRFQPCAYLAYYKKTVSWPLSPRLSPQAILDGSDSDQFFAPGGLLSRTHPTYEFRRGQLQMAQAVEEAIEERRI